MADLEKTIEELEAEVMAELEEANGADAPKMGATPSEKMDKADSNPEDEAMQDTGAAVVSPDQGDAPAKKVAAKAKEISGDAAQKKEGPPDGMDKAKEAGKNKPLAAGYEPEGEESLDEMKMGMPGMASYDASTKAEDKDKKESVENRLKSIDVSEHVNALMNGEGDLSEEFKKKAATVFEAAVKSKVRTEVERLEDEYRTELEENINTTKSELTERVDTYLNYVVEEWMKENELAIERGLKGEIAEDFISGLKQLFEDHYVDVPDEKYDVLEAQSEKISELEGKINEMMEKSIQMKNENASLVKEQVVSELSSDLAETEIEKFKGLVEDVDYSNEESYREKLATLKESYFPKVKPSDTPVAETIDDVETGNAQSDIDTTDSMAAYMTAIGRTVKK